MALNKIVDGIDGHRGSDYNYELNVDENSSISYDFSKSHLQKNDINLIKDQLKSKGLDNKINSMWNGENINYTEKRMVLHYLLRDNSILNKVEEYTKNVDEEVAANKILKSEPDCKEVLGSEKREIYEELCKIYDFNCNFSSMRGITGKNFDSIVNIGIGGSDLGPRMATKALEYFSLGYKVHFISNVDPSEPVTVMKSIDPESTLFIIVSKTFTTLETIENFKLVLSLFKQYLEPDFSEQDICLKHFIAVTSNKVEAEKYGIKKIFKMWDYVGGRYSLWSAVGISISLYVGFKNYLKLLRGASKADQNFYENKTNSISTRMAINEIFYINQGYNNKCIVPYDCYLKELYRYLQQAEMESNGKKTSKQMIIWGGLGTDVQHSFFQLLHQGEQKIYTEFLVAGKNLHEEENVFVKEHQKMLISNCLAQSRALMIGVNEGDKEKDIVGDKPSVTIVYSMLTPEVLGALLSIYEHKIFVYGVFSGINSFDQYGVQLGKEISLEIFSKLADEGEGLDSSTRELIKKINKF